MGKFTSNLRQRLLKRVAQPHHDMKPCACLGCGVVLASAQFSGDEGDEKPHEDAISVCFQCGHIQAFGPDLRFRPLTDAEIIEIAGDPEIVLIGNIRGPMRDLMNTYKTLSAEEVERRIAFLVEQVNKAERRKHAGN
jgi:hypothetical protein